MELTRASGVLLHPTSLPGRGTGDLGDAAYRFVDWLAGAGQSYWQLLPLVAVGAGGSPYNGLSALAGNPLLVSPERLVREGLLEEEDLSSVPAGSGPIDFPWLAEWKQALLARAYRAFARGAAPSLREPFQRYRARNAAWLEDFALFRALRAHHRGRPWSAWPRELRDREPAALERAAGELAEAVGDYRFQQFLFDRQWSELREYANARGVRIVGDIPIFVAHDSADVWVHRDLFALNAHGDPVVVSGVPPDYFSETGQRWGNPLYRWEVMAERGYAWWIERFRRTLEWVDLLRLDHFRGFESYWEVPAEEETALRGRWRPGPGAALFHAVERSLGELPIIAEDLGLITPEVEALRDELGLPGMRVLEFGFDGEPDNPHLPENYPVNSVVYTGTHDNDTAAGWWAQLNPAERERVESRFPPGPGAVSWELIRLVFESRAMLAVVPLQDVLGLGSEARMNTPGTIERNWCWRLDERRLTREVQEQLRDLTRRAGRLAPPAAARDHSEPAEAGE